MADELEIEQIQLEEPRIDEYAEGQWTNISIEVPPSFIPLFRRTMRGLKVALDTDKDFPCIEAMTMETFNSIPHEIWDFIDQADA